VLDELALSVRKWSCAKCGSVHNRDVNAAINLKNMAASFAVTACGEDRSGAQMSKRVKRTSVKQEPNAKAWACPSLG